jgi:hypothetical protein
MVCLPRLYLPSLKKSNKGRAFQIASYVPVFSNVSEIMTIFSRLSINILEISEPSPLGHRGDLPHSDADIGAH